ncbi:MULTISPECIES: helix-turn-helix domain-containing protein [unclassified Butyricimonas]|uniref:helix-turn-helix domain-containing protein n=1 Tax=unclassified Butyricimonas TaxID=2637652 RepID=UPI000B39C031|nr:MULTISPECIES: helix-turn-helix transcriptional regulator [unclassified Butyricimonas]OUN62580.1 hypothetical protein B5G13_18035 [Butyricimonas sp. An62]
MRTTIEQYIIDRVREKRIELGKSQRELSLDIACDMGLIGRVESLKGKDKYNINHLNALAVVLGCSIKDFFPDQPFIDKNSKYLSAL